MLLEVKVYSCERQERDDVIVIEQEQRGDYCVAVEVLLAWLTDALNEWDGSVIFFLNKERKGYCSKKREESPLLSSNITPTLLSLNFGLRSNYNLNSNITLPLNSLSRQYCAEILLN